MSSDEKLNVAPGSVGRKVAFVGGPEAGKARVIPESVGEYVQTEDEYVYRIIPFKLNGNGPPLYFAFAANEPPIKLLFAMWEEYSIAAQIRGGDFGHMQRLRPDIKER